MAIEAVRQFLTKVNHDEKSQSELSEAMGAKKDLTAAVELAARHGYEFTLEELATQIEQLKRIQAEEQLREEELEAVAGGLRWSSPSYWGSSPPSSYIDSLTSYTNLLKQYDKNQN